MPTSTPELPASSSDAPESTSTSTDTAPRSAARTVSRSVRILTWLRLLTGAGFIYQGTQHILGMWAQRDLAALHTVWQGWPAVGGMRPLEVVIIVAILEFSLGVFLFGGLLTRILSALAVLLTGLQAVALGFDSGLVNLLLLVGAAIVFVRGGGVGTMDALLGKMQRKSMERQREREAEAAARRAARRAVAKQTAQDQTTTR
ncbi:MAG: DoxX family protein [Chloroflexi bacterium]|nr:DoxX family protein [Chloroflexota bacterium]